MKAILNTKKILVVMIVGVFVSLASCNSNDDSSPYVFVPLTQAEKTQQINQMQGDYVGYIHYNYSYLYYAYMDSVKVNWNVRANDSTLTIQNFPMKVFVENIVDKNMREALQNDSIHSIPSRVVLYRPWGTTGTLQNAYFNFIPKGSNDFTVEIPLEIDGVEKKVSFIFNSVYMNSTYSVGAFNTNEMAFNMILKQLKIEGERTYDANTLVVIYGKKS